MPDPNPGSGEVRIRVAASGVNPGDIKKREDSFGYGMAYPRVIPHSDGAGMVFKNIRIYFLGSDDFPAEAKTAAARDLNAALGAGWPGFLIGERIPLADIARSHELVEHPSRPGRIVVML